VWLEGLGQLKNAITSREIETATFRLLQCLNKLYYNDDNNNNKNNNNKKNIIMESGRAKNNTKNEHKKKTSERTTPAERLPLVGEVSINFCG
jgi:hypothetical protein